MEDLSEGVRLPSGFFEELRHRHHVWQQFTKRLVVAHDSSLFCPQSTQHAASAWIADRVLHVGSLERRPVGPQPIKVWGLYDIPRKSPAVIAQIVNHDQQDVWTFRTVDRASRNSDHCKADEKKSGDFHGTFSRWVVHEQIRAQSSRSLTSRWRPIPQKSSFVNIFLSLARWRLTCPCHRI